MVMKSIDGNVVDWIRQRFTLPHFRSCRRLVVWAHGTLVGGYCVCTTSKTTGIVCLYSCTDFYFETRLQPNHAAYVGTSTYKKRKE